MEAIPNAVWFPKKRVYYINDKFFEPSIPPDSPVNELRHSISALLIVPGEVTTTFA